MAESADGRHHERGSGSVLVLGIACVTLALVAMLVPLYSVFASRSELASVADAAALAAADTRSGFSMTGTVAEPCARAAELAATAGARLVACGIDGLVVTVSVTKTILGVPLEQSATAGPPPAESENRRIR